MALAMENNALVKVYNNQTEHETKVKKTKLQQQLTIEETPLQGLDCSKRNQSSCTCTSRKKVGEIAESIRFTAPNLPNPT
jgi:hypothetical protein